MKRRCPSTAFLPLHERARRRDLSVTAEEVARMIAALSDRGWVKAETLARETGWNARHLRALANASNGQILGWVLGYAVTREVGDDEADRVERRLLSQAREMTSRAVAIGACGTESWRPDYLLSRWRAAAAFGCAFWRFQLGNTGRFY